MKQKQTAAKYVEESLLSPGDQRKGRSSLQFPQGDGRPGGGDHSSAVCLPLLSTQKLFESNQLWPASISLSIGVVRHSGERRYDPHRKCVIKKMINVTESQTFKLIKGEVSVGIGFVWIG